MEAFWIGFILGGIFVFTGLAVYACCANASELDREEERKWNL